MSLSQATDPVTEIEVSREIRGLVVRVLVPLTETHAAVIRREILAAWGGRKDPKGVVLISVTWVTSIEQAWECCWSWCREHVRRVSHLSLRLWGHR
jgi:hypothetical protein